MRPDHWGDGPPSFLPFFGGFMFLLFLALLVTAFLLMRRGTFGPPPWAAPSRAPEAEAKKILADRFAAGDIGAEEFMERASVLNWTPGSEQWAHPAKSKRR